MQKQFDSYLSQVWNPMSACMLLWTSIKCIYLITLFFIQFERNIMIIVGTDQFLWFIKVLMMMTRYICTLRLSYRIRRYSKGKWSIFNHQLKCFAPPPLRGQFLYPKCGQKQTFFDPLPPHLVHVVIKWPLVWK